MTNSPQTSGPRPGPELVKDTDYGLDTSDRVMSQHANSERSAVDDFEDTLGHSDLLTVRLKLRYLHPHLDHPDLEDSRPPKQARLRVPDKQLSIEIPIQKHVEDADEAPSYPDFDAPKGDAAPPSRLVIRLITQTLNSLPAATRPRYREEWSADVADLKGKWRQLRWALGVRVHARALNRSILMGTARLSMEFERQEP